MEKFRENEKEYKNRKLTNSAMLDQMEKKGKFKFEDGDDYYDSDENSDDSAEASDDMYGDTAGDDINIDKKWL